MNPVSLASYSAASGEGEGFWVLLRGIGWIIRFLDALAHPVIFFAILLVCALIAVVVRIVRRRRGT